MFSANQKPFVLCTRVTNFALVLQICTLVTEELHSFLSQSELSNSFGYINYYITNIGQVTSLIKIKTDSVICTRLFEQVGHLLVFSSEQLYNLAKPMDQINFPLS